MRIIYLGNLMTEVKVDPPKSEKDYDLMLADYVFFFKDDVQEVSSYIRKCEENRKFRVEFIHKYTNEQSYCVGVIEQF